MSRKLILIILSSAVLIVLMYSAVEATSQPSFCAQCHEISPLVERWRQYSHNQVSCIECHADPGALGVLKRKVGAYKEIYLHFFGKETLKIKANVNFENCVLCHTGKRASKFPQAPNIAEGKEAVVSVHTNILAEKVSCLNCHREVAHGNLGD